MKSKKTKIISIFLASCLSIALFILGWQYRTPAQVRPTLSSAGLTLEKVLALSWKREGVSKEAALKNNSAIPSAYQNYKFQAMYPGNLETAYQQITSGK